MRINSKSIYTKKQKTVAGYLNVNRTCFQIFGLIILTIKEHTFTSTTLVTQCRTVIFSLKNITFLIAVYALEQLYTRYHQNAFFQLEVSFLSSKVYLSGYRSKI